MPVNFRRLFEESCCKDIKITRLIFLFILSVDDSEFKNSELNEEEKNKEKQFENFENISVILGVVLFLIGIIGVYVFNKSMWNFDENILPWELYLWITIILWGISSLILLFGTWIIAFTIIITVLNSE